MFYKDKLRGLKVVVFESRRAAEMAKMLGPFGCEVISAPAMREAPLEGTPQTLEFARNLKKGGFHVVVFMTGVGVRYLAEILSAEIPRGEWEHLLAGITTVARGPKPVVALRELGVIPTLVAREPNTWREVLAVLERMDLQGKQVAVQEYGEENPELLAGLKGKGAVVTRVPVYRWALPENILPLQNAIAGILEGKLNIVLFTSATQIEHIFKLASDVAEPLRKAFSKMVVASIGPICTQSLQRHGLQADVEPEHPKMGPLVMAVARQGREILKRKESK